LVAGSRYYYEVRGLWDERQTVNLMRAEAARQLGDRCEEALALAQYVEIRSKQEDVTETERCLARIQEIVQGTELPDDVAFAVAHAYALNAWMSHDLSAAEAHWRRLLPLAQQIGGQKYVITRHWLANCLYLQGNVDEAHALYSHALDDAERIGDLRSVVGNRIKLALIDLDRGNMADAETALTACYSTAQQYHDRRRMGEIRYLLARIYMGRSDTLAAHSALAEAIDLFERFSMWRELVEARATLGHLADGSSSLL
jgi:tetratricopeptide (TPR) repeat protein